MQALPLMYPVNPTMPVILMNKKELYLPCSAFSYRVLVARYGSAPNAGQRINRDLWELLQINPIVEWVAGRDILTHHLPVTITGKLESVIRDRDIESIGIAIHKHLVREMYRFTEAQVLAGAEAWGSLQSWYALHDLGEDERSFETTYRKWLTYKESQCKSILESFPAKNGKVVNAKTRLDVRKSVHQLSQHLAGQIPSPYKVEDVIRRYKGGNIRQSASCRIWLLKNVCRLSAGQVAMRLRCSRRNVFSRCRTVETAITNAGPLAHHLVKLMQLLIQHT